MQSSVWAEKGTNHTKLSMKDITPGINLTFTANSKNLVGTSEKLSIDLELQADGDRRTLLHACSKMSDSSTLR